MGQDCIQRYVESGFKTLPIKVVLQSDEKDNLNPEVLLDEALEALLQEVPLNEETAIAEGLGLLATI